MSDETIDFAWRVHDALNDWTGKVDFKASIVLALETGLAAVMVPVAAGGGPLHGLTGSREGLFITGLVLLAIAVFCSMLVVTPQLDRWKSRRSGDRWKTNTIYFGHLRHWTVDELEVHLQTRVDNLRQLAQQQIAMSKIAWRKHAYMQYSMVSLGLAIALLALAAII